MKVRNASGGTDTITSADDYSARVARLLTNHLMLRVAQSPTEIFPSPEELVDRLSDLVLGDEARPNELVERLSPFWSAEKAANELGTGRRLTRQALAERRTNGSVLGLPTSDRKMVYPVAQFHRVNGRVEVKPGVKAIVSVLRDADPWATALLLHTKADELGGLTPLEAISQGIDPGALADYADLVRREWGIREAGAA